jgi:hypothetical protein
VQVDARACPLRNQTIGALNLFSATAAAVVDGTWDGTIKA